MLDEKIYSNIVLEYASKYRIDFNLLLDNITK